MKYRIVLDGVVQADTPEAALRRLAEYLADRKYGENPLEYGGKLTVTEDE